MLRRWFLRLLGFKHAAEVRVVNGGSHVPDEVRRGLLCAAAGIRPEDVKGHPKSKSKDSEEHLGQSSDNGQGR